MSFFQFPKLEYCQRYQDFENNEGVTFDEEEAVENQEALVFYDGIAILVHYWTKVHWYQEWLDWKNSEKIFLRSILGKA